MTIARQLQSIIESVLLPGGSKQPAVIIYGPRQVGKTTLVREIVAKAQVRSEYFNCDYQDVRSVFAYETIGSIGPTLQNLDLIVLDEAQRIANIGLVLKILVDEYPQVQVISTGSSSFELSNQIAESLAGRQRTFHLYPLTLQELHTTSSLLTRQRALPSLLRFGSYPDAALADERQAPGLLRELVNSYVFKDIFAYQTVKKTEILTSLLRLLAFQIGSEVSYQELAIQLGIDQTVVQRYIQLLEDTFILYRLGGYRRNLRSEITKSRKIYFWDLGIRNALIDNFSPLESRPDTGALWENFAVTERIEQNHYHDRTNRPFFWRTYGQQEIDYLEESTDHLSAFEFKWNQNRKTRIPSAFATAYPTASFDLITPHDLSGSFFA
ncbi:hypothetical protein AUK40_06250 [Candidatus Wirthbacteria bacterium CG2_30_54_11]|uniref:AAA+ ATPase domain-containing protein n=1 Tax=Candidatus Wirthbacteria bacterium CG2_30_54_11 TaxID=1817892 RepID=A0A1J5IDM1_9BACT|nr:MAG: hypothetical protein AUK40_06250 [Candidatus Wirthbacteria bacterium CG2_30_54_11]